MPDAFELPGMRRAVVELVRRERLAGFVGGVVNEFVALAHGHAFGRDGGQAGRGSGLEPALPAVVGALNYLSEPAAGLGGVDAVGIRG